MAIQVHGIDEAIVEVRGQRVILSADLARIYGVDTRSLNQAIKRNAERFPKDFVLRLTRREARTVARLRSQSVILKQGEHTKYLPLAFTEHGAVMAASVLNSRPAVHMSIFVVRAFLRLRQWAANQAELAARLDQLEGHIGRHDAEIVQIIAAIRQLMAPPRSGRRIGFKADRAASRV